MTEAVRYSERWTLLVQPGFQSLIDRAATSNGTKAQEWARSVLAEALRAAGFDPAPKPSRTAGELCDLYEGKQRWVWVEDGQIKAEAHQDEQPAEGWLPLVHVNSEPFDKATHWRLAPITTIETDRVVRTFPVVLKSLEHA